MRSSGSPLRAAYKAPGQVRHDLLQARPFRLLPGHLGINPAGHGSATLASVPALRGQAVVWTLLSMIFTSSAKNNSPAGVSEMTLSRLSSGLGLD